MTEDPRTRGGPTSPDTLLCDLNGSVATITLNRPVVLNALNRQLLHQLDATILQLQDNPATRVILIRGAGKAFAAGADISELEAASADEGERMAREAQRVFARVERCGIPTIACIDGYALGGGCELALACTFRFATSTARLGLPELKLGIIPGFGGTQRLPRLIGRSAALKLILTGAPIEAAEAYRLGLVDEVVSEGCEAMMIRARAFAEMVARQPPLAVAAALEAVTHGENLTLDEGLAMEARLMGRLCGTEDKQEGTSAFREKRAPVWRGR